MEFLSLSRRRSFLRRGERINGCFRRLPFYVKKKRHFCSLFFLCWTFPHLLSKVPRSLWEFFFPLFVLPFYVLVRATRSLAICRARTLDQVSFKSHLPAPKKIYLSRGTPGWYNACVGTKLICFVTREKMAGKTWTMTRRKVLRCLVVHHSLLLQTTSVRHLLLKPREKILLSVLMYLWPSITLKAACKKLHFPNRIKASVRWIEVWLGLVNN